MWPTDGDLPAVLDRLHTLEVWWTAVLDAGLPPGALAGTDDFAAAVPSEVRLLPGPTPPTPRPGQAPATSPNAPPPTHVSPTPSSWTHICSPARH
ncbi:hypothetical protein [Streptomyces sp. NRRL B-3648]|uniref:hypothetical protein n=1 Tax=Streptomyces sp. NRRL B-3648 TaxID=1519493 RepID=UPI0006AEC1C6|nr:hypothetical protein [Streptomyces sp. NRRL B-3648]KOV91567.1 hypothetical protein ADL04_32940 [Streptomyces sp. NRRL B-3648]